MNHKLLADPMALTPDDLMRQAEALRLDMAKFRQCLESNDAEASVRQRMREASELGIEGTPMFLVGIRKPGSGAIRALRMIEGGYPYEVFKATLETILAAQE
jgi:predicted DsbA family dithiol-disulfide isomerase